MRRISSEREDGWSCCRAKNRAIMTQSISRFRLQTSLPLYLPVLLTGFMIAGLLWMSACSSEEEGFRFTDQGREVPAFDSDSAYRHIETQVGFGPRVPNTEAHRQAIQYYHTHFSEQAGPRGVYVQSFTQEVYGDSLQLYNLIASFSPEKSDRIILAAHWDSRPRGEQDLHQPELPVPGADDGASGVAVLMEFASIFKENPPPVGVDIVLFDGEDYGEEGDLDHYFLGSRYWSENPPVPGYSPRFGILLDMVGGAGAQFPKEGYSMDFAPSLVNEIWRIGQEFGHSDLFREERGGRIADDHIVVQRITGIPMINIIHHSTDNRGGAHFAEYWHTQRDDLEIIDPGVMQAVGDVLLELIYNRIPS